MASGRRFLRNSPTVWHLALCLTVVCLLARAFVPLGFMPDAEQLKQGTLALTFCSASGEIKTLDVDVGGASASPAAAQTVAQALISGDASHPATDVSAAADCPYSVSASHTLAARLLAPPSVAAIYRPLTPTPLVSAERPFVALGPPLGSRAPPLHVV